MTKGTRGRLVWRDAAILAFAVLVFIALMSLGTWQMQRLAWKTDLIARVEARVNAPPMALPSGPVSEDAHEYLRVATSGVFLHDKAARVKAVTDLGPGHWLMTPLDMGGNTLWVNRGFVPQRAQASDWTAPASPQTVEGLVRVSEPGGTLLERNQPEAGRWVSRDIAALSAAAGLENALSYFVDADHAGAAEDWPRGGLTQVAFRNTHLSYALTWYAMALLFLAGMVYVIRDRIRARSGAASSGFR